MNIVSDRLIGDPASRIVMLLVSHLELCSLQCAGPVLGRNSMEEGNQ